MVLVSNSRRYLNRVEQSVGATSVAISAGKLAVGSQSAWRWWLEQISKYGKSCVRFLSVDIVFSHLADFVCLAADFTAQTAALAAPTLCSTRFNHWREFETSINAGIF